MRFTTLDDWLCWIESCHPEDIELGLERVASVAARLHLNLDKPYVITVAGTNGKGSCVEALASVLIAAGFNVGCYTSPHFLAYNERVSINRVAVDDETLVNAFNRIDQQAENTPLTYFEYGTLAAIDIFQRAALDVVILEVGLGGRLDAVNIIASDMAIVTNIALDHEAWLGNDRESIAQEKAGIFRAGCPAICGDPNPPAAIQNVAKSTGSILYQRERDFFQTIDKTQDLTWHNNEHTYRIKAPKLPLDSIAVALQALDLLPLSVPESSIQTIGECELTGRFQQRTIQGRELIFDVAHNPAAASYLARRLQQKPCEGRTIALTAIMSDKDIQGMLEPLAPIIDCWCVANLHNNPRALSAALLTETLNSLGETVVNASQNFTEAYQKAMALSVPGDRFIIFGSFFTVAELIAIIERK